jgi:hypothetical protein
MTRLRHTCLIGALVAMLFSVAYWVDERWPPPEEQPRVGEELDDQRGC